MLHIYWFATMYLSNINHDNSRRSPIDNIHLFITCILLNTLRLLVFFNYRHVHIVFKLCEFAKLPSFNGKVNLTGVFFIATKRTLKSKRKRSIAIIFIKQGHIS